MFCFGNLWAIFLVLGIESQVFGFSWHMPLALTLKDTSLSLPLTLTLKLKDQVLGFDREGWILPLCLWPLSWPWPRELFLLASPEYYRNRAALVKRLRRDVRCGNATTLACEERTSEWLLTSTNGFRRRRLSVRLVQQPSSTRHTHPDVLSSLTDRSRDQSPTIGAMHFGARGADCKCPIRLVPSVGSCFCMKNCRIDVRCDSASEGLANAFRFNLLQWRTQ